MGPRETPNRSASSVSTRRDPAGRRPSRISSRSWSDTDSHSCLCANDVIGISVDRKGYQCAAAYIEGGQELLT